MELEELREIRACLPKGRTLFYYERDWYQVMLLEFLLKAGWSAREIRQSNFARLLERKEIKSILAAKGRLDIRQEDMTQLYLKAPIPWRLTLGVWGGYKFVRYKQITRRGFNIVLQVNFPRQHNRLYRELISNEEIDHFNYVGHPVAKKELTMSWVRLDVDLNAGEVLIEELQTDWLRRAEYLGRSPAYFARRLLREARNSGRNVNRNHNEVCRNIRSYVDEVLPRYTDCWQETALTAAIFFSVFELGIRRIFLHDFETGNRLKFIHTSCYYPPRSLYTRLPRKFCFRNVDEAPKFASEIVTQIQKAKKRKHRVEQPRFWLLDLGKQRPA